LLLPKGKEARGSGGGRYFRAMAGSSIGKAFKLVSFGESHGPAIGGVVEGCPAGLKLDLAALQHELDRRRPGSTPMGTTREEADRLELLSGVLDGITLGTPIGFIIRNGDARSGDYAQLKEAYRPGHADLTWDRKFGVRDHRGGGRASARETAVRVAAGAMARQFLGPVGIQVHAWTSQVGEERCDKEPEAMDLQATYGHAVRCPDPEAARRMEALIAEVRAEGDTVGGRVSGLVRGVPAGLGEPVFDKLHADLGKALFSINAVKGVSFGSGFGAAAMRGSAHNDAYVDKGGRIGTATNRSGGLQGGISNGEDIRFEVAFKPVSTLMRGGMGVDRQGRPVQLEGKGRHDPCVVPRAVPIVEAMACLVLADHLLRQRLARA
jgi:chorismate synthase